MANVFYNRMIRKLTVAFGDLFNNITLVRYNPDNSEQERFIVPIDYATKELYVMRIQGDPNLDKKVMMTLPRMSYEMNGLNYDSSRKQITNIKYFSQNGEITNSQYVPVPYDFDFSLYLYVRNIEDGNQIIEHILPYFTPDYTIKVNMIPEMGIVKEVPIILKDTKYDVTYEGDYTSDTRMVIWTLNFTVKGFVFGATSAANIIKTSITNIYNKITDKDTVIFTLDALGEGNYKIGELVYQGPSASTSTSSGKVVSWDSLNRKLTLNSLNGNFISGQKMVGLLSNASWLFASYSIATIDYANIVITPEYGDSSEDLLTGVGIEDILTENNAEDLLTETNSNGPIDPYTYNTVIKEYPNT
jgi:hypothetical protein